MPTEREWANAEVVDGKIYVLGGEVSFHGPLDDRLVNAIEEYNPKINTWRKRPGIPMPKCWFETVVVDNEIWTIGGYDRNNWFRHIDAVDIYNPRVNKWRRSTTDNGSKVNNGGCCEWHHLSLGRLVRQHKRNIFTYR